MELFTPGHLIVLAIVVAVLFFGWKNLPDMTRSLGRSLRIFKTEIKGMSEDDSAREAAREQARDEAREHAEATGQNKPKAVEPARPVARAQVVRNDVGPSVVKEPAATGRPRPTPQGGSSRVAS